MKSMGKIIYGGRNDFAPGIYRCNDNINNFKIRVCFHQDKSAFIPLPQFNSDLNDPEVHDGTIPSFESEERTFSWQEKVFSKIEIGFYSNADNCRTSLQQKYHRLVSQLDHNNKSRLFSYTEADGYYEKVDILTKCQLDDMKDSTLTRRPKISFAKPQSSESLIVDYSVSKMKKKKGLHYQIQTMYIMVDLNYVRSDDQEIFPNREFVLCRITYDRQQSLLTVTPDFSPPPIEGNSEPYLLEIDEDARNTCQFWLVHASEYHEEILPKQHIQSISMGHPNIESNWEFQNINTSKIFIFGEIVLAKDFEYEQIFVQYCIELPTGWSSLSSSALSGVTQKSKSNSKGVAHFGHLFEVELNQPENKDFNIRMPQLLVRVLSMDSWSRCRCEGYAAVILPISYGVHTVNIATWRPILPSITSEMKRFFIGGAYLGMQDLTFAGIPSTHEDKVLGKLGIQTITSGEIQVRLNVVQHSEKSSPRKDHFVGLNSSALLSSVEAVLAAFSRARHRMLRARQGLQ